MFTEVINNLGEIDTPVGRRPLDRNDSHPLNDSVIVTESGNRVSNVTSLFIL